ncbi:hypothetical protein JW898_05730 [Candidatus Woesearchaeota archaeon]|nr:hypothetical protein [Candidatus Woesearchaeota archaeon]
MGDVEHSMRRQQADGGPHNWKQSGSSDTLPEESPEDQERRVKREEERARLGKLARIKVDTFYAHMKGWVKEQPHWRLIDPKMLADMYFSKHPVTALEGLNRQGTDIITEHRIDDVRESFALMVMEEVAIRFPLILGSRLHAEGYILTAREDEAAAYSNESNSLIYNPAQGRMSQAPRAKGLEDTVVELLLGCSPDAVKTILNAKSRNHLLLRERRLRRAYSAAAQDVLYDIDAVTHLARHRTGIDTQDRDAQCLPSFLESVRKLRYT